MDMIHIINNESDYEVHTENINKKSNLQQNQYAGSQE
jgi:hypothetical protein